jgi:hypothetical protein
MKPSAAALLFLLTAAPLTAEEPPAVDASREALQKFVASIPEPPPPHPRNVTFHIGAIEFRALGARWRFNYLPIMLPLSGSRMGVTREWPDPFELSQASIATTSRSFTTRRAANAEMRRIEKTERAKIKVKTK